MFYFKNKCVCRAAKQKIRQRNIKIRLLSDHISTKNQTKSRPKCAILRSKSDLLKKTLIPTLSKSTFLWKYSVFRKLFKLFVAYVESWKSENLNLFTFRNKKRTFQAKRGPIWEHFFLQKGPLSEQGLIKRTYFAALDVVLHDLKSNIKTN